MQSLRPSDSLTAASWIAYITGFARDLLGIRGFPEGADWVEDAEALGLVRLTGGRREPRKPYREYVAEHALDRLNPGINVKESNKLIASAESSCPWLRGRLRPHPFKPGFVVLPGANLEEFTELLPAGCESLSLHELMSKNGFGVLDPAAAAAFSEELQSYPAVASISLWWDRLPPFEFTLIGKVIAFMNARRHLDFGGKRTVAELLGLPPTEARDPA